MRATTGFAGRAICAVLAAIAGAVAALAPLPLSPGGGGLVGAAFGAGQAILASALAGALLLPGFAGRGRGWLRAAVGGLICAPVALWLTLAPEMVWIGLQRGAEAFGEQLLTALLGGLWVLVAAGPVFVVAGLVARLILRRGG